MHEQCPDMHEARGKDEAMQQERMHKLCSERRSVYHKHGAKRNLYDESTAFGNTHRSACEETTATFSNRRTSAASRGKDTAVMAFLLR